MMRSQARRTSFKKMPGIIKPTSSWHLPSIKRTSWTRQKAITSLPLTSSLGIPRHGRASSSCTSARRARS
ncbi:hypothetical protein VTK26DRAFT_4481 [Humicola hyalothermophila]